MAIPRKGSRLIVVDGHRYRWLIRREGTIMQLDYGYGNLHVAIEKVGDSGATAVIFTDRPHPQDWGTVKAVSITPRDIEKWIREALELGWKPSNNGPQTQMWLRDGSLEMNR